MFIPIRGHKQITYQGGTFQPWPTVVAHPRTLVSQATSLPPGSSVPLGPIIPSPLPRSPRPPPRTRLIPLTQLIPRMSPPRTRLFHPVQLLASVATMEPKMDPIQLFPKSPFQTSLPPRPKDLK